jgi:hypothetical protein
MADIKVAVSPFYGGEDWTCDKTGITFRRSVNGLNVYTVSTDLDLTNIRKAIRLNALLLMKGELPEAPVEEVKQPKQEEVKVEEPKVEVEVEAKEEVVEEKPKAKPATKSRKTTKSTK